MRGVLVAFVLAALVAVAGVLAQTLAAPDPNVLAVADGCERNDSTLIQGRSTNWARVMDSTTKATDAPPPLRWAEGVANANGVPWYSPHVSGGDLPYSHAGYDFNLDVLLDPDRLAQPVITLGIEVDHLTAQHVGEDRQQLSGRGLAAPRGTGAQHGRRVVLPRALAHIEEHRLARAGQRVADQQTSPRADRVRRCRDHRADLLGQEHLVVATDPRQLGRFAAFFALLLFV